MATTKEDAMTAANEWIEDLARLGACIRLFRSHLNNFSGGFDKAEAVRLFAFFARLKEELDKLLTQIAEEIGTETSNREAGRLQKQVMEYWTSTGRSSEKLNGRLIYLQRRLWASCLNLDTLKANGLTSAFVKETVNGQTLSSFVRELPENDEGMPAIPAELVDAIQVTEKFQIVAKKG